MNQTIPWSQEYGDADRVRVSEVGSYPFLLCTFTSHDGTAKAELLLTKTPIRFHGVLTMALDLTLDHWLKRIDGKNYLGIVERSSDGGIDWQIEFPEFTAYNQTPCRYIIHLTKEEAVRLMNKLYILPHNTWFSD